MTKLLSRLLMWQKLSILLALAVGMFSVPTVVLIQEKGVMLEFTQKELQGVAPVGQMIGLLQAVQKHRGVTNVMLTGNTSVVSQREALKNDVQSRASAVAQALAEIPHKDQWVVWQRDWNTLAEAIGKGSISAPDAFAKHVQLVDSILDLTEDVADHFGLTLDPTAEGYFLQNSLVIHLPKVAESMAMMRGKGSGYLAAKEVGATDRATLLNLQRQADHARITLDNQLRKAFEVDASLKAELTGPMKAANDASVKLLDLVKAEILDAPKLAYSQTEFFAQASAAVDAQFALAQAAEKSLNRVLTERAASLSQARTQMVVLSAVMLALLLGLGIAIVRAVTRPLGRAVDIAAHVAQGSLNMKIDASGKDEVAQLLGAMQSMQMVLKQFQSAQSEMAAQHEAGHISHFIDASDLPGAYGELAAGTNAMVKAHIEVNFKALGLVNDYVQGKFDEAMPELPGEKHKVTEAVNGARETMAKAAEAARVNLRVRNALDNVSLPVRIATDDGTIVYINEALRNVLHRDRAAFSQAIAGFDPEKVVGSSIGMFYQDSQAALSRLVTIIQ